MRDEKDIPWLTDRFWGLARVSGLERKLKQPPPVLTEQQRRRANDHQTVLAILLARAAANENAVREFRKRALEDHVLPPADVEAWLQQQAAKDGKPTIWLRDVAIPPGYEVQRLPHSWLNFTRPPLLISEEHPGRASSRMLACALPGRPPIALITSAGGILEELRKLSKRLAREFSWSSMQAALFVLTDEVPTVPLVKVTTEYSSQRPACTRIILDVDPIASPRLIAEHFRQTRRKVFARRVRTLGLKHLRLAAFIAEHP